MIPYVCMKLTDGYTVTDMFPSVVRGASVVRAHNEDGKYYGYRFHANGEFVRMGNGRNYNYLLQGVDLFS